jgi:hypothetical protein
MRKAVIAALAVALLVPAIFASSAGAGAGVKAPKDCLKPQNRPHRIVLACADFSLFVNTIHWDVWKSNKAKGNGVLQVNDCNPNCASGTFNTYPVKIKLEKPKETNCGGDRVNMFHRAELKYTGAKPPNANAYKNTKLFCN